MRLRYFSCLLLCYISCLGTFAQSGDPALLATVLKDIEKQHRVEFSYIESDINFLKVVPPPTSFSLDAKLVAISRQTLLAFTKVNNRYISVSDNPQKKVRFQLFLKDNEWKKPVENARITIFPSETVVYSDEQGYAYSTDKQITAITIEHLNHATVRLTEVNPLHGTVVYLNVKPTQLQEVATHFYFTKGVTKKWDTGYEINPKQFGLLPGLTEADVFESVKQIPGVISADETLSNLTIRGGTQDQILFQWNGMRLYQVSHFFGLLSAINPNLTHKINIVKNGTSPFLGESVSGVVSLSTLDDTEKSPPLELGANLINVDATFRHRFSKNARLALSARRAITDVLNTPTYQNYFDRVFQNTVVTDLGQAATTNYATESNFYFFDFTGQYAQKIGAKTTLTFDFITISNQLNFKQSRQENSLRIEKDNGLDQETFGGVINGTIAWNAKTNSAVKAFFTRHELYASNEALFSNQTTFIRNDINHLGLEWRQTYTWTPEITLDAGYQFDAISNQNISRVNSPFVDRNEVNVLQNHALIAKLTWQRKAFKCSGGLRQNYFERWGVWLTEPRFTATWQFHPAWEWEWAGEMKSQTVSKIVDRQQDFLGIERRRWIFSNNEDRPILQSRQLSTGITFKNSGWLWGTELFAKKVTGITGRSQDFQNQYENLDFNGDFLVYGAEILLQKKWENWVSWITYSYNYNTYTFKGLRPESEFPNNNEIRHHIAAGIGYVNKALKITLGGKWFSGRPTTLPSEPAVLFDPQAGNSFINYQSPNSDRLPEFFQLNASGSYAFTFQKHTLTLGASVINLTNTQNRINQFFRINTNAQTLEQIDTFSLARTVNVFVRYSL